MRNETRQRLHDALLSCRAVGRHTAGLDQADYQRDELVRDAVERRLGIIGEALRRAESLDPAVVKHIPELRQIVGLRNRLIHGYDSVDDDIIWNAVQYKLPLLEVHLAALLEVDDA